MSPGPFAVALDFAHDQDTVLAKGGDPAMKVAGAVTAAGPRCSTFYSDFAVRS